MPQKDPKPIIGVVGGVGPHAGYDLSLKILEETQADSDQAHIPVVVVSEGDSIPDRTTFLDGTAPSKGFYFVISLPYCSLV